MKNEKIYLMCTFLQIQYFYRKTGSWNVVIVYESRCGQVFSSSDECPAK